jgi:hypothetical protein
MEPVQILRRTAATEEDLIYHIRRLRALSVTIEPMHAPVLRESADGAEDIRERSEASSHPAVRRPLVPFGANSDGSTACPFKRTATTDRTVRLQEGKEGVRVLQYCPTSPETVPFSPYMYNRVLASPCPG